MNQLVVRLGCVQNAVEPVIKWGMLAVNPIRGEVVC
jgi:hypothetical protein